MARGFTSLLTILLLTGVSGFGQLIPGIGYPGGGYPGRRYPQGAPRGPASGRPPDKSASAFIGILRKIGDNNVVVESAGDQTITTISTSNSTKYVSASGGSAKIGDFQPGDHVNVSAKQNSKGVYHAATMTMVSEGTPEEHSAASLATGDTSRPLSSKSSVSSSANGSSGNDGPTLRRAASSSDNSSPVAGNDDDHPRLRRAASSSDDTPKAQIAPGDSDDSAPPQLRRANPVGSSTPSTDAPSLNRPSIDTPSIKPGAEVAAARPSLHADETNGQPRMPQRMPTSGDPFIDQTREAAFAFSETLPNYVVKQYTTRYATVAARGGRTSWQALDNVSADVIEEDGTEKYKNILVNGKPPLRDVEKTGSWSRGEFSSLLQDVLSPLTNADFRGKRATTIVNRAAFRYEFSVEQPNSHWHVEVESQPYMPAYSGSIWVDKENYRVLRIEMSAQGMPRDYPLDQVEWAVDYDYVLIGEGKYLLPVHSESLSCARGTNQCTRNTIEFRNYRKFTADTSITFEPDE
jgi:hypothetical protein